MIAESVLNTAIDLRPRARKRSAWTAGVTCLARQTGLGWIICTHCGIPTGRPDGGPVALPDGGRLGCDPRQANWVRQFL